MSSIRCPLDGRNVVGRLAFQKRADRARLGIPHVHIALQSDGDAVGAGPVQQVQVVVVDEPRGVQHPLGDRVDAPLDLLCIDGHERPVVLRGEHHRALGFRGLGLERQDPLVQCESACFSDLGGVLEVGERRGRRASSRLWTVVIALECARGSSRVGPRDETVASTGSLELSLGLLGRTCTREGPVRGDTVESEG